LPLKSNRLLPLRTYPPPYTSLHNMMSGMYQDYPYTIASKWFLKSRVKACGRRDRSSNRLEPKHAFHVSTLTLSYMNRVVLFSETQTNGDDVVPSRHVPA
jgi:hypothetical protein